MTAKQARYAITTYNAEGNGYSVAEYEYLTDARREYEEMREAHPFRHLILDELLQQDGITFKHSIA